MKRAGILAMYILVCSSLVTSAHAEFQFQLAPNKETAQVSTQTKTQAQTQSGGDFSNELSVLSDLEAKIVAKVPQPIKDKFADLEKFRIENAQKYAKMRDMAESGTTLSATKEDTKDKTTVTITPPLGYYYYYALTIFFTYTYVFYGVILLGIFFVLRIILRSFNIIP